jgi:hypothetical protein
MRTEEDLDEYIDKIKEKLSDRGNFKIPFFMIANSLNQKSDNSLELLLKALNENLSDFHFSETCDKGIYP